MEKILSVAVPAYNAEHCLETCLSSMLAPDVLERLEIIVIDDGSTDSTGRIADRYAAKYPMSISVIHKENGGHGSGINAAAKAAGGKYFRVVDADDWLITGNLAAHLDELEHCGADVVVNSFHRVKMKSGRRIPVEIPLPLRGLTVSLEELPPLLGAVRNCFTIHGISYRLECYRASGALLSEKVFYEDNEFTTLPFSHVRSVFFSPLFLYQYLIGNQEQSVSDQNQVKRLPQLEQVLFRICGFLRGEEKLPPAARGYITEKAAALVTACLTVCLLREPDRPEGRMRAERLMARLRESCPPVYERSLLQYRRLLKMHRIHLGGRTLDAILDSSLYLAVRNQLRKLR